MVLKFLTSFLANKTKNKLNQLICCGICFDGLRIWSSKTTAGIKIYLMLSVILESRRGRPSSDCGYRSDSRQNHTGQGNEMLKKLVFEPYQRSESTSNSFSSRGGRHESRRGRPSSTARSDSRQNHIGRGPRDITQKDQPQRRSQYQGPRDITQKDQPQRRSQYQDSSLDDKFSTSSREAKSAVKSDYSDIKLTKKSVSEVSKIVKRFIEDFQQKLEEISSLTFEEIELRVNSEPDEFDFMFSPKHVNVKPDYSGATEGYCKLEVMSVPPEIQSSSTSGKYLDPSKLRGYIFDLFDKVFADSLFRKSRQTKKKHRTGDSPAYTILYTGIPNKVLDIDLVPAIKILGWPDKARRVNPTWTDDSKLKAECMEYYHAVAKSCPDGSDIAVCYHFNI
ncbi:hypothetical protein KUTeg_003957 [Tegillarca granosa]|uniref:Mab-21-like nucleotidyltransferase domain-containing protein n=1 Tax=Tegillarca granosa TaxID=220873 RepID=A0ABQ9FRT1_TEGGR|nr:hypothetical protein KUTeg_003957 [Tegillarca granosa]